MVVNVCSLRTYLCICILFFLHADITQKKVLSNCYSNNSILYCIKHYMIWYAAFLCIVFNWTFTGNRV